MKHNKKLLSEEAVSEIRSRIPVMAKNIHEGWVSDAVDLARGVGNTIKDIGSAALQGTKTGVGIGWNRMKTGTMNAARLGRDVARVVGRDIIAKSAKEAWQQHDATTIANSHQELNRHQFQLEQTWAKKLGMRHSDLRNIQENAPKQAPVIPNLANLPQGVNASDVRKEFERDRELWNAKVDLNHRIAGIHAADPETRRTANYVNGYRRHLNKITNQQHEEPWWANPGSIPQKI